MVLLLNCYVVPKHLKLDVVRSQVIPLMKNLTNPSEAIKRGGHIGNNVTNIKGTVAFILYMIAANHKNIYVRSPIDFILVYISQLISLKQKSVKIVYDFRAIPSEELKLNGKGYVKVMAMSLIEAFVFQKADTICTVSHKLKDYLTSKYFYRNISVHPCFYHGVELNKTVKKKSDRIDFCYAGGMSAWQNIDELLLIYSNTIERYGSNSCHLNIYTKEIEKALKKVTRAGLDITSVNVTSVKQELILTELAKSDFGFLLRSKNLVNKTASPIKFYEYLAAGLGVVISESCGDFSDVVRDNCLGLVVNSEEKYIDIEQLLLIKHNNLNHSIRDYYSALSQEEFLSNHPMS